MIIDIRDGSDWVEGAYKEEMIEPEHMTHMEEDRVIFNLDTEHLKALWEDAYVDLELLARKIMYIESLQ